MRFPDVDNLKSGRGTREVDHSHTVLTFVLPLYFTMNNCVNELLRAVVRNKQIIVMLPDAGVHGVFTEAMIREIVTDQWVAEMRLHDQLDRWITEWGGGTRRSTDCSAHLWRAL
eukprot:7162496-Prymnesium_polylepis.2